MLPLRRLLTAAAAVVAVPLLAVLPVGSAQAASTHVVAVTPSGFNPNPQPALVGDSVRFRNDTNVAITLTYGSTWPGAHTESVNSGATTPARRLTRTGSYTVSAADTLTGQLFHFSGSVKVTAPTPTATSPAPRPTRTSTSPQPTAGTSSPVASVSAGPSSGSAGPPPISSGNNPPPGGGPSTAPNPAPSVAPPATDPPALAGGSKTALLQPHAVRRLGLPGAVSAVLALGLLFGIVRVLLSVAPPPADRGVS